MAETLTPQMQQAAEIPEPEMPRIPSYQGYSRAGGAAVGFFAGLGIAAAPILAAMTRLGEEALQKAGAAGAKAKNASAAAMLIVPATAAVLGALIGYKKADHAIGRHDMLKHEVERTRQHLAHAKSKRKEAEFEFGGAALQHTHARHQLNDVRRGEVEPWRSHDSRYHEAAHAHIRAGHQQNHANDHHDRAEQDHASALHDLALHEHAELPADGWAARIAAEKEHGLDTHHIS